MIYCDNEPSLKSHTIISMLSNNFGVRITNVPPLHSTSNRQIERFHSTLLQLARCMKIDLGIGDTIELIKLATAQDNKSVHSVVNRRPADIFLAHPDEPQEEMYNRIQKAQTALRARENASWQNRYFQPKTRQQAYASVPRKICQSGHGDHSPL